MNIADELQKLQSLHESGALTDAEYATAKARVLQGQSAAPGAAPFDSNVLQKFTRSKRDCWLGGVCGGLANLTPIPSWCWRLGFCLMFFAGGLGAVPYVLLWIFVPEESSA